MQQPRVGYEGDALFGVGRHRGGQPPERHVAERVDDAPEDVGDVGVGDLAVLTEARDDQEQRRRADGQRQGGEDDVGPHLAPFGSGFIDQGAHDGVVDGVPDAGDDHQQARGPRAEQENIGVEEQDVRVDKTDNQVLAEARHRERPNVGFGQVFFFKHALERRHKGLPHRTAARRRTVDESISFRPPRCQTARRLSCPRPADMV
ncbi:MAG: hypothetical protein BWY37_01756 [Firmicutes bacterium ADurb.Bin262]|nr:MAG: hypothetical protein BWY37_01756 [Firmicutes bacterium ADurb.Bin262]